MSRAGTLYAVSADTAYDGSVVVAVFDTSKDADAFAEKCREHDRRMPLTPDQIADTPDNDAAWSTWAVKCDRWRRKHPGKQSHTYDGWSVFTIRYFKAQP